MRNRQTCTIGDLHLIRAAVALLDVHPSHVVGEVVGGAGVEEPWLARAWLVGGRIASTVVLVLERLFDAFFCTGGPHAPNTCRLDRGGDRAGGCSARHRRFPGRL